MQSERGNAYTKEYQWPCCVSSSLMGSARKNVCDLFDWYTRVYSLSQETLPPVRAAILIRMTDVQVRHRPLVALSVCVTMRLCLALVSWNPLVESVSMNPSGLAESKGGWKLQVWMKPNVKSSTLCLLSNTSH